MPFIYCEARCEGLSLPFGALHMRKRSDGWSPEAHSQVHESVLLNSSL